MNSSPDFHKGYASRDAYRNPFSFEQRWTQLLSWSGFVLCDSLAGFSFTASHQLSQISVPLFEA